MKFYLDAWIKEGQKGSSCACGLSLGSGAPQFALGEKRRFRPETKGAELINAQPYLNRRKLDEGEVVGRKPVVACRNATIMLDLVEVPLDQVAGNDRD